MQGGGFTLSSLGALGGQGFTPIVNAPEVAILGVSRLAVKPVWDGSEFVPRKMLPLSLSYDHKALNGGDAGRLDRKITRLNSSHVAISYAVFCLKKKKKQNITDK